MTYSVKRAFISASIVLLFIGGMWMHSPIMKKTTKSLEKLFSKSSNEKLGEDVPHFVVVACKGPEVGNVTNRDSWSFQLRRINVCLKSAALLTSVVLHFSIVTDSEEAYNEIVSIPENWPVEYRNKIVFSSRKEVYYPPDLQSIKSMFTRCATARLFLQNIFKDVDSVIYVDTDTIFMNPPENLWKHFKHFNNRQVIGVAPALINYPRKHFPSYGSSGLNSGVLLMKLARLRHLPGGWINIIKTTTIKYEKYLKDADQDILNIIFSGRNGSMVFRIGCEWNYNMYLCYAGRNRCGIIADRGVAILHGCGEGFTHPFSTVTKPVFEAWEKYDLHLPPMKLLPIIEGELQKIDKSLGRCSKIPNIDDFMMKGLRKYLAIRYGNTMNI